MADLRPPEATSQTRDDGVGPSGPLLVEFDLTVVEGEAGRRLAVLQAEVILDVLTWLHDHPTSEPAGH